MIVRIDRTSNDPLYLQIRAQVIASIAQGDLVPGDALPSVRSLADDLSVNLHTVNKAYAILRDEGYVLMRGRSGARVVDPSYGRGEEVGMESRHLDDGLYSLALEHRAHGGDIEGYLARARLEAERAYGEDGR